MARLPPGPAGEPLFGSSRRFARDPLGFLATLESAYGSVAHFRMGPGDVYVVTDPAGIERFLVSAADEVRKPDFGGDALGDLLGEGLLLSEGETWRRQRELATPAFAASRIAGMADRITGHAESLVADWTAGDVIDVEAAMTGVTIDVIADLMLGVDLDADTRERVREQLVPLGTRFVPDPIRFAVPEWVPLPGDRAYDAAVAELDAIVTDVIERRRATRDDDDGAGATDFLAILLRAADRGAVTPEQVRDEVVTTLLAGHDTTALALSYTWYLLSTAPGTSARLFTEIDEVLDGERPAADHVRAFDLAERVVRESMRLYPPVFTLFREPTRDMVVDGYVIPAGSTVLLPQWAVHRSDRHWTDPDTFDPERWITERTDDRPRFAYFPFGGGPRICIGQHLAMLEAQLILATVASRYRLEYLGDGPPALQPALTVHPAETLSMRVEARDTA